VDKIIQKVVFDAGLAATFAKAVFCFFVCEDFVDFRKLIANSQSGKT
jgi:hypothetical protein